MNGQQTAPSFSWMGPAVDRLESSQVSRLVILNVPLLCGHRPDTCLLSAVQLTD